MTDIAASTATTATINVGGTVTGSLEVVGDHDWYAINLTAGQTLVFSEDGSALTPDPDSYLNLRDASGNIIAWNDDSGGSLNSAIYYEVTTSGTYYLDAGAWDMQSQDSTPPQGNYIKGTYTLSVQSYTAPPVYTYDQIANQLTNGYWTDYDGQGPHHFNVTQGGTITVNISTLTAAEQTLALAALGQWHDIIGVNFQTVTTGGQIVFSDAEDPSSPDGIASTTASSSGGITTKANIDISTSWVNTYGTSLDSYSFQTYLHEIGHALGLGHAGDYNGDATYATDAIFANDSWNTSVMSYFSATDNFYFANQGFTQNFLVTPMDADIVAMQNLYGLSTTTRTGNTTYGFNSNAGNLFNASVYPDVAYTIFDSGGTDTLDYSGFSNNQLINLNPETFMNVGANVGNVMIARGVTIENAVGGSGDDTVIGNAANNILNGGAGQDTVSYETASAGVTVNLGVTAQQSTVGSGADTLTGFERLIGSAFADVLIGGPTTMSISGGAGNDLIKAGTATGLAMSGGDGDDTFVPGAGNESIDGGSGFNTIDLSSAIAGVVVGTSVNFGNSPYNVSNVQKIIGSNYADHFYAWNAGDVLIGAAGDDTLTSEGTNAQLIGGTGNDIYELSTATDQIIENPGEGTDLVVASGNYTLGANIENLTLFEYGSPAEDWFGTGNSLANVITGNGGANSLSGLAGDDTLIGSGGNDTLDGGSGIDTMSGGAGDDTYIVDNSADVVTENAAQGTDLVNASVSFTLATDVENLTLTGSSAINGTGNGLANVITGNAAANVLDGKAGADTMSGGAGNDTYVVDNASDVVTENPGEGTDLVNSSIGYTLGANLENLTLTGTAAIDGTGNGLANVIRGNGAANALDGGAGNDQLYGNAGADSLLGGVGNDQLYGGTGADAMSGGAGNDHYYVDNALDAVSENAGEGVDLVNSAVSYTLGANIENLTLVGTAAIDGTGNGLANVIRGNGAANVLDAGVGNDTLYGGAGNDTLIGGDGNDTLNGETGNDTLIGGDGIDRLDGNTGADTMSGGAGDDRYYVDNALDAVSENALEGSDLVYASVGYTLGANVENLTLTGAAAIDGTGNTLNNVIRGNASANVLSGGDGNDHLYGNAGADTLAGGDGIDLLDGGTGADAMSGGAGNDLYYVDNALDAVSENALEGSDLVYASIGYTLGANVENLTLTGAGAIGGTGNGLANAIRGNEAANVLDGGDGNDRLYGNGGNDTLIGGAGTDHMTGGAGNDLFVFDDGAFGGTTASTADEIVDFTAGADTIDLSAVDANSLLGGDQAFAFIGTAAFSDTAGELRYEQISGNTYLTGDTNGDGIADFMIKVDGSHVFTGADFGL